MEKNKENDDYTFLQEKIKERPINKKKLFKQSLTTILLAVVFGLVACVTFMLLEPVIERWMEPTETASEKVALTLPEEKEELRPENMIQDERELVDPEEAIEQIGIVSSGSVSQKSVRLSDYQQVYDELNVLIETGSKSLVTVISTTEDVTWLSSTVQNEKTSTGLIVADNGLKYFILIKTGNLRSASKIEVEFYNGSLAEGVLQGVDSGTGFSILAVDKSQLLPEDIEKITIAALGNSNTGANCGDLVVAIGSPMGYPNSVGYGVVISSGTEVNTLDHNYKLIGTDIYGSRNADGFLINSHGQIIGIIDQSYNTTDMTNQISALGVSEFRLLIEALSNQSTRSYMGVYLTNISKKVAQKEGIPQGVYVNNVALDSPALNYGIRKGDIITKLNNIIIATSEDYEEELHKYQPGDAVVVSVRRTGADGYDEVNLTVIVAEMPGGIPSN